MWGGQARERRTPKSAVCSRNAACRLWHSDPPRTKVRLGPGGCTSRLHSNAHAWSRRQRRRRQGRYVEECNTAAQPCTAREARVNLAKRRSVGLAATLFLVH